MNKEEKLTELLKRILDDATGSVVEEKRVWPIRASLYREIAQEINYHGYGDFVRYRDETSTVWELYGICCSGCCKSAW